MKLKSKINLFSAALFIGLLLLINCAIYFTFNRMMFDSELERIKVEARQKVKGMHEAESSVPIENLLRAYMPANGMLQIVRSDGTPRAAVTSAGNSDLRKIPVEYKNKELANIFEYDHIPYGFVSMPVIWSSGEVSELQLTENLATTAHNLRTLKIVLIAITIIACIPVLLASSMLSNFIISPISSLIKTMKEIQGSGRYKRIDLPKQSKDELYQMGETFNNMIGQLEQNYVKQEQFVSNASHELKTPLTVIEAYADLLKRRGKETPELFDESIEAIQSESHRMKELIEQLLLLAKHDEQWKVTVEEIHINALIGEAVRSFCAGYKRKIEFEEKADVTVKSDAQKLKQLFYILMDNAQKYSKDTIYVSIGRKRDKVVIEIIDRGVGIPTAELPKVFDRFYRVEKSRARASGGFGLGLSLAKELADAIGAEVKLESVEGVGTTAQILL
ncbi:two-component sensor histidine kinase [Bacillus freudenreichii]|nr:two-component sensor histidine kinase [Bacillus freudenreichii]